jgi:hypothetical protein
VTRGMADQTVQATAITFEFITVFSPLPERLGEVTGLSGLRTRG